MIRIIGGGRIETAEAFAGQKRPIRRRPHVSPLIRSRIVEQDVRVLEFDAATPLEPVAQGGAGKAHKTSPGDIKRGGAIDATNAGRRVARKPLLPGAGREIE